MHNIVSHSAMNISILAIASFLACALCRRPLSLFTIVGVGYFGNVIASFARLSAGVPSFKWLGIGNALAWVFCGSLVVIGIEWIVRSTITRIQSRRASMPAGPPATRNGS